MISVSEVSHEAGTLPERKMARAPMPELILMCWSGGKDSAMALHQLRQRDDVEVVGLLTTCTADYDRVTMHGVRRELVVAQADSLQLPLYEVQIPAGASNQEYERRMKEMLVTQRDQGVTAVGFGDIYLEDLRNYREACLSTIGLRGEFPLWKENAFSLYRRFLDLGFRAVTTCIDPQRLDPKFVGRELDEAFLSELPAAVDPCGENGEYHTFVYDGPGFSRPIRWSRGEVVARDSFLFHDLISEDAPE